MGRNVKVGRGVLVVVSVNVSVGGFVMVAVEVIVGVSVIVEVNVCEGVGVCGSVEVTAAVWVTAGMDEMMADPVALTEETTCVTIRTKATSPATIPRDASEWLRYPGKVTPAKPRSRGLRESSSCSRICWLVIAFRSAALFLSCST